MLDHDIKKRWVAALRSGKYKQGTGQLCHINISGENFYCCLGVLNEIEGLGRRHTNGYIGDFLEQHVQETLSDKNDNGEPFSVIADYIELNL